MTTVDRRRWVETRLRFLMDRLDEGVHDDERRAIEAEIETLQNEFPRRRLRRLLGMPRLPHQK